MKPIIKWVGGKTQLLNKINELKPTKFNNFFELFAGSIAVSLNFNLKNTVINDTNSELINVYICIRKNYKKVIELLEQMKKNYNTSPKEFFLKLREEDRASDFFNKNKYYRAARMIFLNKTCFNGLYRVNSKGFFNVPWNKSDKAPGVYDLENVIKVSQFLNNAEIFNHSYKKIYDRIQKGDFVYLDPPYDKIKDNTFTSYNKHDFGTQEQIELKEFCDMLHLKGAYFMLSNHNTKFINEIYNKYNINIVKAKRFVNSDKNGRGIIDEVLITNY